MRTFVALVMLSIAGLVGADERPRLTGREAPRATDLLRAETLADRARDRLRMPKPAPAGWKHGGSGWDTRATAPASSAPPSVTVRVGAVRKPRRAVD
jgi:hypothetical protein